MPSDNWQQCFLSTIMLVGRTLAAFPLQTQTLSKCKELVIHSFVDSLHIFTCWASCPCCSQKSGNQGCLALALLPGQISKWAIILGQEVLTLCFQTKPLLEYHTLTENGVWEHLFQCREIVFPSESNQVLLSPRGTYTGHSSWTIAFLH